MSISSPTAPIIIIGGGVFGLAAGWVLAKSGLPATLFERGQIGQEATWAAAGMLMPWKLSPSFSQDLFDLQRESHTRWPQFAQALSQESGTNLDFQTPGRYFVALHDSAVRRLRRQYEFHHSIGFPLEYLSGDAARARNPALSSEVMAAVFTPIAAQVDNRQLSQALGQAFVQAGGILREQTPVSEILIEAGQVRGIRLDSEVVARKTIILAAGAWSGQIKGLPLSLQKVVKPRKGQTLTLRMSPERPLIQQQIIGPTYLVPRSDGRLIVGTTVERKAGFDQAPTVDGILTILTKALRTVPGLSDLPLLEVGAGLRPTGPERLPVLGPTSIQGLIMATGGHSHGILLSPIVAQTLSQFILSGDLPALIAPFSPG